MTYMTTGTFVLVQWIGDGVPSVLQDKLMYFRIKELKDVLSQLGLPKQGKKQVLYLRFGYIVPVVH